TARSSVVPWGRRAKNSASRSGRNSLSTNNRANAGCDAAWDAGRRTGSRPIGLIVKRDLAHLDVVAGRDGDVDVHRDPLVSLVELGLVRGEGRPTPIRGRRPHPTGLFVAQVEANAIAAPDHIWREAGDRQALEPQPAAAGIGQDAREATVAENERLRSP